MWPSSGHGDPILPPKLLGTCGTCGVPWSFRGNCLFSDPASAVEGFEVFEESEQIREVGVFVFLPVPIKQVWQKKYTQKITGIDVHGILSNDLLVFIRILFHPYQVGWRIRPLNVGEISTSSHGPLWGPQICWDVEMGQRSTKLWQVTSGFNKKTRRKVVVKSKWDIFF